MIDPYNLDGGRVSVNAIHGSVVPTSCRHVSRQSSDERLSDPMGVFEQWPNHELDDGRRASSLSVIAPSEDEQLCEEALLFE